MIVLSKYFQKKWKGLNVFNILSELKGKVYREKDGRKTFRATIDGKIYFIKLYKGTGWKELLKSIGRFRFPVLSAQKEWEAICQLEALNIETMRLVGYGKKGWSPANRQSFIITDELSATLSLENYCRDWPASPPDPSLKRALITKVARISRQLHKNGWIHRDFYICHFLLDISMGTGNFPQKDLHLYLIDLHRMQKSHCFKQRQKIKDVAALYFSSMDIGLTQLDVFRFMRIYQNASIKKTLQNKSFWGKVNQRASALYYKANGRLPSTIV